MKAFTRFVVPASLCLLIAPAILGAEAKAAAKAKPAASLTLVTPDQLKWEANPGAPEVKMAPVWGDYKKGAHGAFHKFPAGFVAPLHTHSSDMRLVVISGTVIEATEDGKETRLPPGSYAFQPHTVKHVTKCDPASECVIYGTANGKFDIHMADAGAAAKK